MYNTIQYNTIQYNTIQYNTIQYNTIQYNTIQYNTIQYNTIQYNTIQYNTIQYNTIQYNTIQYKFQFCSNWKKIQHSTILKFNRADIQFLKTENTLNLACCDGRLNNSKVIRGALISFEFNPSIVCVIQLLLQALKIPNLRLDGLKFQILLVNTTEV